MNGTLREFHTLGATGTVRAELHEGREHLVVPVVALMQGVIHAVNAQHAEFVPIECLAQSPYGWNGRPVVLGHPTRDGIQISANDPKVLAAHQFGIIFQSHIAGQKLGLEAWIDPKRLEALGQHELLADVRAGKPIEVSVGAFVKTLAEEGIYNGKAYKARWASLIPDHLAFLPKSRGACSIEMGCGAHRLAAAAEMRSAGGPGSGWTAENGHVPGSQGGSKSSKVETFSSKEFEEIFGVEPEELVYSGLDAGHLKVEVKGDKLVGSYRETHEDDEGKEYDVFVEASIDHEPDSDQTKEDQLYDAMDSGRAKVVGRRETKLKTLGRVYHLTDEGFVSLGGPGSGWHAEDGHVPGSQGGTHYKGAKAHIEVRPVSKDSPHYAAGMRHEVYHHGSGQVVAREREEENAVATAKRLSGSDVRSNPLNNEFTKRSDPFLRKEREKRTFVGRAFRKSQTARLKDRLKGLGMDELETLGGPGSGWHAEDGHVPGSQGGKGGEGKGTVGHMKAQRVHNSAARAHEEAAYRLSMVASSTPDTLPGYSSVKEAAEAYSKEAESLTKSAAGRTKETGAKPYSEQAARSYATKAQTGTLEDRAKWHREAAKYHKSAAKDHKIAASWGVKHLEESRSLKERFLALISPFKSQLEEKDVEFIEALAGKKMDCAACKTTGSLNGNPCEACKGKGYTMKANEGEEYPCEVHYSTLSTLLDDIETHYDEATSIAKDLEEEEDNALRTARLDSLVTMFNEIMSAAGAAASLCYRIQHPQLDAQSPRYAEDLKTLIGARNSASDLAKIQTVHDYSIALGASCSSMTAAEEHGGSTAEGDNQMEKKEKDGIIKHLTECPCSGYTKDDVKFLEGLPDEKLKTLDEKAKEGEKAAADLKAAQDKLKENEVQIKALSEKKLTEAEVVAALPERLKTLIMNVDKREKARKEELLKALETPTKDIFTKDELTVKSLEDLEKLATLAGLTPAAPEGDYSAARPLPRALSETDPHTPPDPYAPGVKALQESYKAH